MRARVLFAGLVAISTVVIAGPASAKADIAEATIRGPRLGGAMRIDAPDAYGLWDSGIDVVGGLDDSRADSVEELGLTPADLGSRYRVTYRFHGGDDLIRQDLYPYAKDGPVTYTPPGQELTGLFGDAGDMPITAGWYQSPLRFFDYLVDRGLPKTNPVAPVATRERAPDTTSGAKTEPWARIVVVLVGLTALSLGALAVRRRVLAMGGPNR
jgi:hypothetical protein